MRTSPVGSHVPPTFFVGLIVMDFRYASSRYPGTLSAHTSKVIPGSDSANVFLGYARTRRNQPHAHTSRG
ncbi:MAG: hypothetical protein ACLR4Z_06205 [Butyricicoccaceae bacterium]